MQDRQDRLWKALQCPQFARHVRILHVQWFDTKYITSPPFEERLVRIFLHTSNLRHVELTAGYGTDKENRETLLTVFISLARLETKPKVSFQGIAYTSQSATLSNFKHIMCFNDKLPVIKLQARGTPAELSCVSRFDQLERLDIYASPECQDLYKFLNELPLIKLTVIVGRNDRITSFPLNLRILRLYLSYSATSLFHVTWKAVCGLKRLDELVIHCRTVEDGPSRRFESSNLRLFELVVEHDRGATVVHQIISPIFTDCRRLSVFRFGHSPCSSATLSSILIPSSTLNVGSRPSYIFQTLVDYANRRRPHNITLPWPTGDDGVPEHLTMEQAQHLAAEWCNPHEIEFQLTDSAPNRHPGFDSFSFKNSPNMPFYRSKLRLELSRMSEYALLHSSKLARLIDESSPCLNICTLFFHFEDKQDTQGEPGRNIVMFLSLEQVRRHDGHL
jgi:hypothetical protein